MPKEQKSDLMIWSCWFVCVCVRVRICAQLGWPEDERQLLLEFNRAD